MTRARRLAAAWISASALLLGTTTVAAAAHAQPRATSEATRSVAPTAARRMTSVILLVSGCNGCSIQVQRGISSTSKVHPHLPDYWNGPSGTVRNGRVVLRVPTAWSPGMSFTLRAPWELFRDFVPNIVTRAAGHRPGSTLSATQGSRVRAATACWAGTTRSSVTFHVRVSRFWTQGITQKGWASRSWFSPALASVGALQATTDGTIGNQEAFYC